MNASAAGRIAFRLERGQCPEQWKQALQQNTEQIFIFLVDGDVGTISTDRAAVDDTKNLLSEDCPGGPLERGGQLGRTTDIHTNVAVFNVGPAVAKALRYLTSLEKLTG